MAQYRDARAPTGNWKRNRYLDSGTNEIVQWPQIGLERESNFVARCKIWDISPFEANPKTFKLRNCTNPTNSILNHRYQIWAVKIFSIVLQVDLPAKSPLIWAFLMLVSVQASRVCQLADAIAGNRQQFFWLTLGRSIHSKWFVGAKRAPLDCGR